MMKFIVFSTIIVFLGLVVGGAYYFSNQQSFVEPPIKDPSLNEPLKQNQPEVQISETKIYRNEEFGFEFEYLEGWEVHHSTLSDKNHVLAIVVVSTLGSTDIDFFINDWSKTNEIVFLLEKEVISEININGIIGYEHERTLENKREIVYLFPMGEYWMVISGEKNNSEILQRIIISLRFLNNKNVYRNEEFGFEFEYPCNWVVNREHKSINYYSKLFLKIACPKIVIPRDTEKKQLSLDDSFLTNIVLPEFVDTSFWHSQERVSSIIVGDLEGKKYEYDYQGFPRTTVILPFGELKIILATGDGCRQYLDEFNQILDSFKFLE